MNKKGWLLIGALYVLGIVALYVFFTSRFPGGNDFYSRWVGGRALLREGMNPYSEAVTLRIQEGMYGRPARSDEDQVAFAYPLHSLFFFWPLCFLDNYPLVQAIWLGSLWAGLIVANVLWMQVIHWRPRLWLWALTMLWNVLLYHNFRALMLGQFSIFVLLALVAALWAIRRGHDGWAGFFLALATVKPQIVYLAIPWIMLWAAGRRRWQLWRGFGGSLALLSLGAMTLLPSWIPDFVRQTFAYPSYTVYGSLTWMIVQHFLGLGRTAEIVSLVVLALGVLLSGWRLWRGTWEQMLWILGLLLLLTNFFTPRIATANYVILVPWALWGFCWMQSVWRRRGAWVVVAVEVISLIGLWVLFLATIEGDFESAPVYFPFPAAIMLLLIWLWRQIDERQRQPRA